MNLFNLTCFIATTLGLTSCSSMKNITGTYRSNFADLGFFVTNIKLKSDSTFEYRFRGDMISDTASGHFKVYRRKLILAYNPTPVDTSGLASLRDMGIKVNVSDLRSDANRTHVFYIRHHKLYGSYQDGEIVKKAFGYSKRKKYFLFGTHYYKHRNYLRRID